MQGHGQAYLMPSYYFNERFYIVYNINLIMFYDLLIFIFMSYIKPQLIITTARCQLSYISYYSYIKPQLFPIKDKTNGVVYRTIPTSNHNPRSLDRNKAVVVYHTIPTSNHNRTVQVLLPYTLYIILFLHQTTTWRHFTC